MYMYDMEKMLAYRHRNVTCTSSKDWEWATKMEHVISQSGVALTIATFADGHKEEMPVVDSKPLVLE